MGGQSKKHNWFPKLVFRLFNMTLNNAYKVYAALVEEHTPERRYLDMDESVKEMAHALTQQGEPMRKQRPEHPLWFRPLSGVFEWVTGRKLRTDAQGTVAGAERQPAQRQKTLKTLRTKQKKAPWRKHQNLAYHKRGKCCYKFCPNITKSEAKKQKGIRYLYAL